MKHGGDALFQVARSTGLPLLPPRWSSGTGQTSSGSNKAGLLEVISLGPKSHSVILSEENISPKEGHFTGFILAPLREKHYLAAQGPCFRVQLVYQYRV